MPDPQDPQRPFERDAFFDDPGIVGARWWNRSFDSEAAATRRQAIKALAAVAVVVGGIAVIGVGGVAAAVANAPDQTWRSSLELQRQIGWNVGAFDDPLQFTWPTLGAADGRTALAHIKSTLQATRYAPFQVLTRFEALGAVPTTRLASESYSVTDLATKIVPGRSSGMKSDYQCGETLARIFARSAIQAFVIVDCSGPRSVAFAAGACKTFEPVLVLDNWPHPFGVVTAHETLGALAAYDSELTAGSAARSGATPPPMLVLEHERLDALLDPSEKFDNRYFATLPSAETLKKWSFSQVLLVLERDTSLPEAGDVSAALVAYAAAGIDVRLLLLTTFAWDGAYPGGDDGFLHHFPWGTPVGPAPVFLPPFVRQWRPGAAAPAVSPKAPPAHFGETQVSTRKGVLVDTPSYGGTRDRSSGSGYSGG